MAVQILLERYGVGKKAYLGFSWTSLFLGPFVPLARGKFKEFYWFMGGYIFIGGISAGLGLVILAIIQGIFYNKSYTKNLIYDGYKPTNKDTETILNSYNIVIPKEEEEKDNIVLDDTKVENYVVKNTNKKVQCGGCGAFVNLNNGTCEFCGSVLE